MQHVRVLLSGLFLVACGGGGGGGDDDDDMVDAAGDPVDGAAPDAGGCGRTARPADGPRKVVVSAPYGDGGAAATSYRVLDLTAAGELSDSGASFQMGRAFDGEIAFTPDGAVGIVAQDDGTLGVFRFDDSGAAEVVHAAFAGDFYAARVVMDPGGDVAYVIDTQWRENGGGIYRVAIGCDGTLTELGLWFASKLPANLLLTSGARAVVPAVDWDGQIGEGLDVHLLGWDEEPDWYAGADAFGDDEAIVAGSDKAPLMAP